MDIDSQLFGDNLFISVVVVEFIKSDIVIDFVVPLVLFR